MIEEERFLVHVCNFLSKRPTTNIQLKTQEVKSCSQRTRNRRWRRHKRRSPETMNTNHAMNKTAGGHPSVP